jgi:Tol biopolymer transport system component
MRPVTGAIVVAVATLPLRQADPVVTLVQRDAWRSSSDAASADVSADARYVAFTSYAPLVPADVNDIRDVYVLDRGDGRVRLESVTADGDPSAHDSTHPDLSADGRFLVYETYAERADQDPESRHVVLRDRRYGTLTVIGTRPDGRPPAGWSGTPAISHCGRVVAFASTATSLVPGPDANGAGLDVYLFEAAAGTVRRVSVNANGVQQASGFSARPSVSGDGRFVAFTSSAPLDGRPLPEAAASTPHPTALSQVYVRDVHLNVTRLVSVGSRSRPADGPSWSPAISADGRYVVFVSTATNLAPDDRNGSSDVFLADLLTGAIELVSRSARNGTANGPSAAPAISSNGRFVALQSEASDLVCAQRCPAEAEDINLLPDVFVLDRHTRVMVRVSADVRSGWMEASAGPSIDAAGTVVAFSSRRPIDAADQKNDFDLFVRRIPSTVTIPAR